MKSQSINIKDKKNVKSKIPNALTKKTIEDAHKGIGLGETIKDLKAFLESL